MNFKRIEIFFEFLVFGVALGLTEDLLVVKLTTGEPITSKVIGIAVLVTIPFAFLGEVIIDRVSFTKFFKKWF